MQNFEGCELPLLKLKFLFLHPLYDWTAGMSCFSYSNLWGFIDLLYLRYYLFHLGVSLVFFQVLLY